MLGQHCQTNTRTALPTNKDNHIYHRVTEINQVLLKNNALFTKAVPSEPQLKQILQHSYNCYDQLDFIYHEYAKQSVNYLDPQAVADYTHKILRSTKHLINHLLYWFDAFSLEIVRKTTEVKLSMERHICTRPHCYICLNNINEMKLKEAKQSILGPMQWRGIYEQQLREEREALKKQQLFLNSQERQEYVSSVNFLSRIIKEMEDSAKNYEKLALSVGHQNNNEQHTLFVLQELISKLRSKLGEKYKLKFQNKLKKLLKKMDEKNKNLIIPHEMAVSEQFNLKIGQVEHKQRGSALLLQETTVRKLKEDNKRLRAERDELSDKIEHLKVSALKRQMSGSHSRSVSRKNTTEIKHIKVEEQYNAGNQTNTGRNTVTEKIENKQQNTLLSSSQQNTYLQAKKKGKKKNLVGRMSAFHLKKTENRKSQLSHFLDKTTQENQVAQESQQRHEAEEEENPSVESRNSIVRQSEVEEVVQVKKQFGCQWEQSIYDSINGRELVGAKGNSIKRKPTMGIVQKENEGSMSSNKKERKSKLDSFKNLIPTINTKKNIAADNPLHKKVSSDSRTLREDKLPAQVKDSLAVQDLIQEHPRQSVNSLNFEQRNSEGQQKNAIRRIKNLEDVLKNRTSHQKSRLPNEKVAMVAKTGYGTLLKTPKLQTHLQSKNDLTLDHIRLENAREQKIAYLKARVATQESASAKKEKIVRNVVFKPEHLTLFGGVSESYSYQNCKIDLKLQKLTEEDQQILKGIKAFIQNLKSFKSGLYENILCFLSSPFSTIQKNEVEFRPLTNQMTEKVLLKLLLFHKKKCGTANCGHLQHFCQLIGYSLQE